MTAEAPTRSAPATGAPITAETAAYIDIGTNSARLMVVRFARDHSWTVLSMQKETVRLGEGEFGEVRLLQPEAMERAVTVCARFADLARAHGATRFVTVATAATREARNAPEFVRLLRETAGLEVHVVSGREEARLIYLGLLSRVHVDGRALVIDIGGGSTEVAVGDASGADVVESISLGAIRLAAEGPRPDADGRYKAADYETLKHRVRLTAQHTLRDLGRPDAAAHGTSGTIVNLAAVAARTLHGRTPGRDEPLARKDLRVVAKRLRAMTTAERRALPGLTPARADIIVAGAAILDALLEDLGIETIVALDDCGLREGLLLDDLGRAGQHEVRHGAGVRERSVLQLARATSFDEPHARQVARLALELFDSARASGLHRLGAEERELLGYAALLHDIGTFLSYARHHQHTYYLIRHADLVGFDQEELAVMAATAYFHRKALPAPRFEAFSGLDRRSRKVVRRLGAFLRLAEYLDRGHTGTIAHARLRREADGLVLELETAGDWSLEKWAVERRRDSLEKAFGRPLDVVAVPPPGGGRA
ncbi:MAG TPA: Ppx/GppA phosphatase family protein [Thermoleophilia bacterium]|nr:Ppx/GppA phosphatase family protein [Thermoleophilia bacterium]